MTDDHDNGILRSVPGQFIAEGARLLPEPAASAQDAATSEVTASWLGSISISYLRTRMRHGRHSHWSWVAVRADAIAADPDADG